MSSLIEAIPGKVSGDPVVRGTRIPVRAIVDNFVAGLGAEEIAGLYEGLDVETVWGVIGEMRVAHPV